MVGACLCVPGCVLLGLGGPHLCPGRLECPYVSLWFARPGTEEEGHTGKSLFQLSFHSPSSNFCPIDVYYHRRTRLRHFGSICFRADVSPGHRSGMLPLPMLYQTLQKPRKTLHLLKGYKQTPNWTENGKS